MMRLWRDYGATRVSIVIGGAFAIVVAGLVIFWYLPFGHIDYSIAADDVDQSFSVSDQNSQTFASTTPQFIVTHVSTPQTVKGVYMTSWAAGSATFRKHLFDLIETTEINAVVIDVKDYTGRISFMVDDPMLVETGASEKRIPDIKELIGRLHEKNVYVIARISSFQDSYLINIHPEWAVKTNAGTVWKDYKGVKW